MDAVLTWLTPDGKPLLTETRKMTFHSHPELRIVDFDFDFAAIDKVVFRDTKEGTFAAARGRRARRVAEQGHARSGVEGQADKCPGRRGRGQRVGQAIGMGGLLRACSTARKSAS